MLSVMPCLERVHDEQWQLNHPFDLEEKDSTLIECDKTNIKWLSKTRGKAAGCEKADI